MAEEVRTLLIVKRSGERLRLTIPASYKITFGAFQPSARNDYGHDDGAALRVYETKEKQRAVFRGVESFRDLSLPVEVEKISEAGESSWNSDSDGNSIRTEEVKRDAKWEKE